MGHAGNRTNRTRKEYFLKLILRRKIIDKWISFIKASATKIARPGASQRTAISRTTKNPSGVFCSYTCFLLLDFLDTDLERYFGMGRTHKIFRLGYMFFEDRLGTHRDRTGDGEKHLGWSGRRNTRLTTARFKHVRHIFQG